MNFSTFRGLMALAVVCTCGGAGLSIWGCSEQKVAAHSTIEPVDMDLAKLESGEPLPSNHITVGPHYACYYSIVFSYRERKKSRTDPPPGTSVEYAMYPIVSLTNPQAKSIEEALAAKRGDSEELPPIERFAILVKTDRFKTIGDLPDDGLRREESVRGLVINEIRSLKEDEKRLIREKFPNMDLSKVHVLEEGRRPSSSTTSALALFGGVGLVGLGVLGALVVIILGIISLFRR